MWQWIPEGHDAVLGTLRRATSGPVDDTGTQQFFKKLKGLASEEPENVYRAQGHGLTSVPPEGSEGIFLSLGGRSDRLLALGFEHKDFRPKNTPAGQTVLYDDKGNIVFLKGANGIEITSKQGKIAVNPIAGQNVYLGGDGATGSYSKVVTLDGPAMNVFARIG